MIYYLIAPELHRVKIGFTKNLTTFKKRVSNLQVGCPDKIFPWVLLEGSREDELYLHYQFRDSNVSGEWFRLDSAIATELLQFDRNLMLFRERAMVKKFGMSEEDFVKICCVIVQAKSGLNGVDTFLKQLVTNLRDM